VAWQDRWKRRIIASAAGSISVSAAVAADLDSESVVIGNAYDDELFFPRGSGTRSGDLLFVGRLVSEKGLDLLIEALGRLRRQEIRPRLTVVGGGPERASAERLARALGVVEQVEFVGPVSGEKLAATYASHQTLVIPSRYEEPFGMVALEGIACGCSVVASAGGGLGDAVGPCGRLFQNGDVEGLIAALVEVRENEIARSAFRAAAPAHLAKHLPLRVAAAYRDVLVGAVAGRGRVP